MSNMTKKIAVALSLATLCGTISGCSGNSSSTPSSSTPSSSTPSSSAPSSSTASTAPEETKLDPVSLEWYVCESPLPDDDFVLGEVSKYMQEKINASLNIHLIAGSEYGEKMNPILMSGQDVDIVNVGSGGINYVDFVRKDAFVVMDDLLTTYAPKAYAAIPEGIWDAMRIDGHIYGIPSNKDLVDIRCAKINKTMADDLGLTLPANIKTGKDVLPLIYEAAEKRDAKYPDKAGTPIARDFMGIEEYASFEQINNFVAANIPGIEAYAGQGSGEKVFNVYATPEYRELCLTTAKMVVEGLYPTQVFYYDPDRVDYYGGEYIFYGIGSGYVYMASDAISKNFEATMIPFEKNVASTIYPQYATNCISGTCKNPERAMMALELINSDPWVETTLRFGIEGDYWKESDVKGVVSFEGTKNENPEQRAYAVGGYGAQFGSIMDMTVVFAGYPANFFDLLKKANENAITDTNLGFIFDPKPVENELAACNNAIDTYKLFLTFGMNVEEGETAEQVEVKINGIVDEFVKAMDDAGAQKVLDEAQKQLDAWRAANK